MQLNIITFPLMVAAAVNANRTFSRVYRRTRGINSY